MKNTINIIELDKNIISALDHVEIGMCFALLCAENQENQEELALLFERVDEDSLRVATIAMMFIDKYCVKE